MRWAGSREDLDEFLPMQAPPSVDAFVQRDLVALLVEAGGVISMRGWAAFRRPVVELRDPAAWLEFVGTCRTRSPLHH